MPFSFVAVNRREPRGARRSFSRAPVAQWHLVFMGLAAALVLAGCGGGGGEDSGPPPGLDYKRLGLSVNGLVTGQSLVVQNHGADDFIISANGFVETAKSRPLGSSYAVTVKTQPSGQRCTVARGTGTLIAGGASVLIDCATVAGERNTLGGTISGVTAGQTVVLTNGSEDLALKADGSFAFSTQLPAGAAYAVTVKSRPAGVGCVVRNGSGTVATNVADTVAVRCVPEGALADGLWEREQCDVTSDGIGITDVWGLSKSNATSVSVGSAGIFYRDAQCSGAGEYRQGPMIGGSTILEMRSAANGEMVAYWGVRNFFAAAAPRPLVMVRKSNYLCVIDDSASASAYPDVASLAPAVAAAISARKCYTPR
ncbi:hypothetical protein HNP48_001505 [Acidovorax soli]|uniref:Uncharacterized protein n=1 Tax=Acidovorax soli TaxID=592050 RepID=A0A7X0U878_9BURK|nr:hypothetical protein [Acidovorax soli]MBB6558841.1 hypothetical protein [Acidovorax soli]